MRTTDSDPHAGIDAQAREVLDFWFGAPASADYGKTREAWFHQDRCLELFERLQAFPEMAQPIDYARRHREIIARFGRFPHRNPILGRPSTPEEADYLSQPGTGF